MPAAAAAELNEWNDWNGLISCLAQTPTRTHPPSTVHRPPSNTPPSLCTQQLWLLAAFERTSQLISAAHVTLLSPTTSGRYNHSQHRLFQVDCCTPSRPQCSHECCAAATSNQHSLSLSACLSPLAHSPLAHLLACRVNSSTAHCAASQSGRRSEQRTAAQQTDRTDCLRVGRSHHKLPLAWLLCCAVLCCAMLRCAVQSDNKDSIKRTFTFTDFNTAFGFMSRSALLAEKVSAAQLSYAHPSTQPLQRCRLRTECALCSSPRRLSVESSSGLV